MTLSRRGFIKTTGVAAQAVAEPKRPEAAYIGLQNHDPGDVVWFKEVSVRPLPSTGAK